MNTKEIKITVPEGYEIDRENSTFECIKFKKKGWNYKDVAEKLFKGKKTYYITSPSCIDNFIPKDNGMYYANNATSKKQLQRLLAINKLMNVAEYLNGYWKHDWTSSFRKWYIYYEHDIKLLTVECNQSRQHGSVYFKSKELALQAIEILGEEEVKLALGI